MGAQVPPILIKDGIDSAFVMNLVSKMYHLDDAVLVEFHPASRFSNPEVTSYFERAYALCKKYMIFLMN